MTQNAGRKPYNGNMATESTSKLAVILGEEGLAKLAQATVLVMGVGGVGSNCVEALARGGIGHLIIVDRDVVSASNINRQAIAFRSTIGRPKVDVMREMIADINPACIVETRTDFLLAENIPAFLAEYAGRVDWFVDAIDTVSAKLAIAVYADEHALPLISSMGGGNKTDPQRFRFADIYETSGCPLCRVVRKEARKLGIRKLRVLYSDEPPAQTSVAEGATRAERSDLGTMSYIPPIMGQMIAGWVIRQIVGLESNRGA